MYSARARGASGSGYRRAIRHRWTDRRPFPSDLSGRIAQNLPPADEESAMGAPVGANGATAGCLALHGGGDRDSCCRCSGASAPAAGSERLGQSWPSASAPGSTVAGLPGSKPRMCFLKTQWCSFDVGKPAPRSVPVLAQWESEFVDLASTAGDQSLVGGYSTSRNRASSLASDLGPPQGTRGCRLPDCARPGSSRIWTPAPDCRSWPLRPAWRVSPSCRPPPEVPLMGERDASSLRGATH